MVGGGPYFVRMLSWGPRRSWDRFLPTNHGKNKEKHDFLICFFLDFAIGFGTVRIGFEPRDSGNLNLPHSVTEFRLSGRLQVCPGLGTAELGSGYRFRRRPVQRDTNQGDGLHSDIRRFRAISRNSGPNRAKSGKLKNPKKKQKFIRKSIKGERGGAQGGPGSPPLFPLIDFL